MGSFPLWLSGCILITYLAIEHQLTSACDVVVVNDSSNKLRISMRIIQTKDDGIIGYFEHYQTFSDCLKLVKKDGDAEHEFVGTISIQYVVDIGYRIFLNVFYYQTAGFSWENFELTESNAGTFTENITFQWHNGVSRMVCPSKLILANELLRRLSSN